MRIVGRLEEGIRRDNFRPEPDAMGRWFKTPADAPPACQRTHPVASATILIVDDEPTNLSLLTHLLQPDYPVRAANSEISCLRAAASEPRPDLLLLDVMMPGMDGYAVLARRRASPATAERFGDSADSR